MLRVGGSDQRPGHRGGGQGDPPADAYPTPGEGGPRRPQLAPLRPAWYLGLEGTQAGGPGAAPSPVT